MFLDAECVVYIRVGLRGTLGAETAVNVQEAMTPMKARRGGSELIAREPFLVARNWLSICRS